MSVASRTGTLAFSVFDERQFHIYTLDRQSAEAGRVAVARTEPAPGRLLPPAEPRVQSRVASYLADPITGLAPPGAYTMSEASEYDSELSLDYVGGPSVGVGTDAFGNYVAGGATAFFSDMLGNEWLGVSLQAQGTVKDIGGQVFYRNLKDRWNWGVGAGRTPFISGFQGFGTTEDGERALQQVIQRIFVDQASGQVAYPFNTTLRAEASLSFTRYSFDTEVTEFVLDGFGRIVDRRERSLESPDPLNLAGGSVALVRDNSFFGFTSPVRGSRWRLEVGGTTGTVDFATLLADYRRYFSPTTNLTLAGRGFHYGRYGDTQGLNDSFLQPLFLGYETLIRGYAWDSFEARECTSTPDDACAEFQRLFGQRLGVANLELRLPLLGTERYGLVNAGFLPVDLVAFADAGVAWDDTRPVELEFTRTSADRIPVFSTGGSARINLFGATARGRRPAAASSSAGTATDRIPGAPEPPGAACALPGSAAPGVRSVAVPADDEAAAGRRPRAVAALGHPPVEDLLQEGPGEDAGLGVRPDHPAQRTPGAPERDPTVVLLHLHHPAEVGEDGSRGPEPVVEAPGRRGRLPDPAPGLPEEALGAPRAQIRLQDVDDRLQGGGVSPGELLPGGVRHVVDPGRLSHALPAHADLPDHPVRLECRDVGADGVGAHAQLPGQLGDRVRPAPEKGDQAGPGGGVELVERRHGVRVSMGGRRRTRILAE